MCHAAEACHRARSCFWLEEQHHLISTPEEDVPALHTGDFAQPEYLAVKRRRRREIVRVQARFEDPAHPELGIVRCGCALF